MNVIILSIMLSKSIKNHSEIINTLISIEKDINLSIRKIISCLKKGNKILICGNGGSAADAQHLTAEFLVRLNPKINRNPLPVINLVGDTSTITACSNDYSFVELFSRNFRAFAKKGDILIVITTSGNSLNIIKVLKEAKRKNIFSIGFMGNRGGMSKKYCNLPLILNSNNTARVQESHIFLGHYIFNEVEKSIIKK